MTIEEILYSIILAAIAGLMSFFACKQRRDLGAVVAFVQISYWVRWSLVFLNDKLDFFAQKFASDFSLDLLNQPDGIWALFSNDLFSLQNVGNLKFFIQSLINLPAIRLLENSPMMLLITNAFAGAITGVVAYAYLTRLFNARIATAGLLIASLYPAAVNYSFFSLRDIFIYLFILLNIFSFAWMVLRKTYIALNFTLFVISFICVAALRVAFAPIMMVAPGWLVLTWLLHTFRRVRTAEERRFLVMIVAIVTLVCVAVGGGVAYRIVLQRIGFATVVSPDVLLQNFGDARAARTATATGANANLAVGSESNYLPIALYKRTPVPVRVLIQIAGMIVIPMPWQLTSPTRLFAVFDSVFVIYCMLWMWRLQKDLNAAAQTGGPRLPAVIAQYPPHIFKSLCFGLLLTFALSTVGFGALVTNGGNAFRMRLSTEPYIVFGASIYAGYALTRLNVLRRRLVRAPDLVPGE